MIIYQNPLSVLTRSDKPNENWTNDDVLVVDDHSELGQKILMNQPFFELVLGENGELIDITPIEKQDGPQQSGPTLEERLEAAENMLLAMMM